MNYLLIALAALREIASREPQCIVALVTGLLAVLLTTGKRLAARFVTLGRRGEPAGGATSAV